MGVLLLAGTRKGLFLLHGDETRESWELEGPLLTGWSVFHALRDPGDGSLQVAANSFVYGGTFQRSNDGGKSWAPKNQGVAADFFPEPDNFPEVGQCVHKLLLHPERPERLWQQNHCGVYRSDDRGDNWERLEGNGLPSGFGFPLALDPRDPDVAYVIPEEGAENRVTPNRKLGVYRTTDGGASWKLVSDGLPEPAWGAVMREGLSYDRLEPSGVYFGTQSGSIFASTDGRWTEVARQLPPVLSVEAAAWS